MWLVRSKMHAPDDVRGKCSKGWSPNGHHVSIMVLTEHVTQLYEPWHG